MAKKGLSEIKIGGLGLIGGLTKAMAVERLGAIYCIDDFVMR
jgi:hypothetical protein